MLDAKIEIVRHLDTSCVFLIVANRYAFEVRTFSKLLLMNTRSPPLRGEMTTSLSVNGCGANRQIGGLLDFGTWF